MFEVPPGNYCTGSILGIAPVSQMALSHHDEIPEVWSVDDLR